MGCKIAEEISLFPHCQPGWWDGCGHHVLGSLIVLPDSSSLTKLCQIPSSPPKISDWTIFRGLNACNPVENPLIGGFLNALKMPLKTGIGE